MKYLAIALVVASLGACTTCGAKRNDVSNNDGPRGDMTYRGGSM